MINCRNSSSLQFYEKRADEIKGRERENELMKFWKNVLFQVPGLGKEKCIAIASKYTTFRSLIDDYIGARELKSIAVQKGVKDIKLGSVLADRIYKCLTSSHDL